MIVAYHILLMWFYIKGPNPDAIYKALWVPLHIAVPIFVIISGYFGIRFSIKGLVRLVAPIFVYGVGFYILSHSLYGNELKLSGFFFMSNTPYWFIRTYLFLYLLSPLINRVIAGMTLTVRVITFVILAWISCWCGLMGFDASLHEGYNVVHFALMYLIGNTLFLYKDKLNAIPTWMVLSSYLIVAIGSTILAYVGMRYTHITIIFHLMFEYNSVVLLVHAILFFMLFMRLNIKSRFINYCATSSLAVYLLHCTDVVRALDERCGIPYSRNDIFSTFASGNGSR